MSERERTLWRKWYLQCLPWRSPSAWRIAKRLLSITFYLEQQFQRYQCTAFFSDIKVTRKGTTLMGPDRIMADSCREESECT